MIDNFTLRLDLFGEGGAGAGAATGTGTGDAGTAQGESTTAQTAPTRQSKTKGDYANVVFGKQPTEGAQPQEIETDAKGLTPEQSSENTLEAKNKAFRDLVNGEYKDQYTKATQDIINKRFKETKQFEDTINKQKPVIDMLMQKYKISDGDIEKLTAAIDNDDTYWEQAADDAGMTVTQYKEFQKLQRENAELIKAQRESQAQANVNAQLQKWYAEADAVKAQFPGFDLQQEVQNPQFLSMLRSGVPVEHAYKVIHYDDMMRDAMSTAATRTEQAVVNNIRARGMRPAENASMNQSASIVKNDVHKLTKADRAEIARRAQRGDRIEF